MRGEWSVIGAIAEQRIREAQERGDFDDLPGAGRPLKLDDMSAVPPELRMAYTILRNANCLPPELAERKEIQKLADLLEGCTDERERVRQMEKLRFLILRTRMRHGRPLMLEEHDAYYDRLLARLGSGGKDTAPEKADD
ncbi:MULTISPECIES: DnaJ family domain-containing protein [unclassified Desulfovibrio]|uniref:DnaJ family domain-containing protein n=1 Tax=unclassified Desulfovibrio TaxID=2593640 RepID=UPI0013ED0A5A|nr:MULTISPECIES: DnaJ family domain-containing protein [unclassified Desulfovibrio]